MRCINKVFLIGNLTRDPIKKDTQSGHPIVTFGLATNREWITKDNRRQTSTEFHDLVAWARLGDICFQYLKKGKLIYVEGYLKTRSWTDATGMKRFRTEIVVQDMIMLEKRGREDQGAEDAMVGVSLGGDMGAGGGSEVEMPVSNDEPPPEDAMFEG